MESLAKETYKIENLIDEDDFEDFMEEQKHRILDH